MKPLFALLSLSALSFGSLTAMSQVNPANMVSGVDSILVEAGTGCINRSKTIYTVPAGQTLVLTNLSFTYGTTVSGPVAILDNGVLRWHQPATGGLGQGLGVAMTTGLAFQAGHAVGVLANTCSTSPTFYETISWAGFLSPGTVGVVPSEQREQLGFSLSPNPAWQVVTLRFELDRSADVNLGIYDAQGRRVRTVASGQLRAGTHVKTWDGKTEAGASAPSGVYFARLESSEERSVRRLVRIR